MNVTVFGAGGKTGSLVVERALAAGHNVTLFVHDASTPQPARVRVLACDAEDANAVRHAVKGSPAVVDALGGKTPYKETELESTAAHNIVSAMQAEGVRRLVVVSMLGVGDSKEQSPFWYEYLMQPTFLRGADKDKTGMEDAVKTSGLEFVIARPPLLTDDAATGSIKVVSGEAKAHKITRADLAQWLVDQLTSSAYVGQAVVIANS